MTWIRCVWLKWHAKCSVLGAFKVYFSAEFSSIANQTHLNKLVFDCFCLWVFLPLGLSSASEIHLRPGNRLGHCWTFHFYTFKNSWVASVVCFGSLSICTKHCPINFCIWLNVGTKYIHKPFCLLASSLFCHINSKRQWPSATGSHACPCHHTASTMFYPSKKVFFQN